MAIHFLSKNDLIAQTGKQTIYRDSFPANTRNEKKVEETLPVLSGKP
jgi:hypothetical protein